MYCPGFHSFLADLANSGQRSDPTTPARSARLPSSSVPDMLGYTVGQGEIAIRRVVAPERLTSDTAQRAQRRNQWYFDSYPMCFKIRLSNIGQLRKHCRGYAENPRNPRCTRYKRNDYRWFASRYAQHKSNLFAADWKIFGTADGPTGFLPLLDSNLALRQGAYHITSASWIV